MTSRESRSSPATTLTSNTPQPQSYQLTKHNTASATTHATLVTALPPPPIHTARPTAECSCNTASSCTTGAPPHKESLPTAATAACAVQPRQHSSAAEQLQQTQRKLQPPPTSWCRTSFGCPAQSMATTSPQRDASRCALFVCVCGTWPGWHAHSYASRNCLPVGEGLVALRCKCCVVSGMRSEWC